MEIPDPIVIGRGAVAVARTVRRRNASVVMVTDGPPISRVHQIVQNIPAAEREAVLMQESITVVRGYGVAKDPSTVVVDARTVHTKRLVLATGSAPVVPARSDLADVPYLTNETLFQLTALPKHLVALGGGATGCEMALVVRRSGDSAGGCPSHHGQGRTRRMAGDPRQLHRTRHRRRGQQHRDCGGKKPPGCADRDERRSHRRHAPARCGWPQTTSGMSQSPVT